MSKSFACCSFTTKNFNIIHNYIWDEVLPYKNCYHEWMNGKTWIITDEPEYFDPFYILMNSIDKYISDNDISKNKKIVDDYGLFKALKLQNDEYGMDSLLDDEKRFYAILAYNIVKEDIEYIEHTYEQYKQLNKNILEDDEDEPIAYRTRSKISV